MTEKLFETALGIAAPWCVAGVELNAAARALTIRIDFAPGSRFAVPGQAGVHPVHDTGARRLRHLNFFQHECCLEVRPPRVKLPDGSVRTIEPEWAGRRKGFTLLFEALVLARAMTFRAVARLVNLSRHRGGWRSVNTMSSRPFGRPTSRGCATRPLTRPRAPAATTASRSPPMPRARGPRRVIFVTEGRAAPAIERGWPPTSRPTGPTRAGHRIGLDRHVARLPQGGR
jgi:hypothetical protein